MPEAALAGVSVPSHRQEIHPSVYCQDQNHCLGEETFKIFSYLSSPIERGGDNRPYLVKWLNFIHNPLIFFCKSNLLPHPSVFHFFLVNLHSESQQRDEYDNMNGLVKFQLFS